MSGNKKFLKWRCLENGFYAQKTTVDSPWLLLSTRTRNALFNFLQYDSKFKSKFKKPAEEVTGRDITSLSEFEVHKAKGIGFKGVLELETWLESFGLAFSTGNRYLRDSRMRKDKYGLLLRDAETKIRRQAYEIKRLLKTIESMRNFMRRGSEIGGKVTKEIANASN